MQPVPLDVFDLGWSPNRRTKSVPKSVSSLLCVPKSPAGCASAGNTHCCLKLVEQLRAAAQPVAHIRHGGLVDSLQWHGGSSGSAFALRGQRAGALCIRCVRAATAKASLVSLQSVAGLGTTYLDVNEPAALARVIRERSKDGQLVLYTYHAAGPAAQMYQDMAMQMCDQLNNLSLPYIVLAHDAAGCDELLAAAAGLVEQLPYCVVDGMMRKTRGYQTDHNDVFTLWIRRYHTAALIAEAGVGVTLLDADTVITRDFLPVLKELSREYALIGLGEQPMNGGTWHLRASNGSSAALWVIKEIERRSTLFNKFKVHSVSHRGVDPGLRMDQDELGDALRVAASPNGSAFDFWADYKNTQYKDHELWQRFQQKEPTLYFQWQEGASM